jgi:hypothetical protein
MVNGPWRSRQFYFSEGPALGSKAAHQRRGAADRDEYREAACVIAGLGNQMTEQPKVYLTKSLRDYFAGFKTICSSL